MFNSFQPLAFSLLFPVASDSVFELPDSSLHSVKHVYTNANDTIGYYEIDPPLRYSFCLKPQNMFRDIRHVDGKALHQAMEYVCAHNMRVILEMSHCMNGLPSLISIGILNYDAKDFQ